MPIKATKRHFNDNDLSTLGNICHAAAERYAEHAKTLRDLSSKPTPPEGAMFPHGLQAARLAEQFERQEREARDFAALFADALPFAVETDQEELAS